MLQQHIDALTRGQIMSRIFILLWAQPKSKDIQYANKLITLPGRSEIGERDVPEYADGQPIPGAVLLTDEFGEDEDGNNRLYFDALKAVHYFLGISPKKDSKGRVTNGDPKSAVYRAGLSVLPFPCTPNEVEATLHLAKERVEAFDYETALRVINEVDQRNAARSAHGQEPVGGGKAYNDAVLYKRKYEDQQAQKVGLVAQMASQDPGAEEDELQFLAYAKLKIMGYAEKVGSATPEQRAKLVDEWIQDPEIRKDLKQKYNLTIRRKGYGEGVGFKDTTATTPADDSMLDDGAPVPS